MNDQPAVEHPTPASELENILRALTSSRPLDDLVASLGERNPPTTSVRDARIEPTRFRSVRAIDFRPWTADDFGVAELELADPGEWSLPDLERLAGPLHPVPMLHQGGAQLQGTWEDPDLPAWAAIYLRLDGPPEDASSRVQSIVIRTEPPTDAPGR